MITTDVLTCIDHLHCIVQKPFLPIADAKNALKKGFLMGSNIFKKQENVQSWAGTHLMI